MGEINKDQKDEEVKNVQPPIYGSQPKVDDHNEEGSSSESKRANEEDASRVAGAGSLKQPIHGNLQTRDLENRDEDFPELSVDDDIYEQGRFTSRSLLHEMEDGNMMSQVEGDDEDILGETENSRRNQQRTQETKFNKGSSMDR